MAGKAGGNKINASKNDNDARKIFVGGLSWESTAEDLKEYFQRFGEVLDATLKTDINTGRSRGFGFVLFKDVSSVDKVVADRSHVLHGKNIDPKRAVAGGVPGREPVKKIFVGGLDPGLTEEEIIEHFSQYGKVEQVELPFDKAKNMRRAFGFITFESEEIVDNICSTPKIPFGDKMVDVKKATPKDQQEGFAGRGGRGAGSQRGGGAGRGAPMGYPPAYDYNGSYPTAYPGYDYYGQPGGYPPAPQNAGYDGSYYSQGWGGYDTATPGGAYSTSYPAPGGYNYGAGGAWGPGGDPAAGAAPSGGFGKGKRGGAAGQPQAAGGYRYHPYNR